MSKPDRTEAELWFTGGTICFLLAIAGFGYGLSIENFSAFIAPFA